MHLSYTLRATANTIFERDLIFYGFHLFYYTICQSIKHIVNLDMV